MGAVVVGDEGAAGRPVTVVLADDESLVRTGLRMILEGDPGIRIVGEAADGLAAVQAVEALRPDVVLLDIRMPGLDGLEAARRIGEARPETAVVMLTAFDTEAFVADALAAGARGFLLKSSSPEELVAAVHAATRAELPFSPAVLRRVARLAARSSVPAADAQALADLSERELGVARLVAEGRSNAEIAAKLHLSQATVKTYMNRIFAKTGAENRVQLALQVERARVAGAVAG